MLESRVGRVSGHDRSTGLDCGVRTGQSRVDPSRSVTATVPCGPTAAGAAPRGARRRPTAGAEKQIKAKVLSRTPPKAA
jgi:hypothetical protein